MLQTRHCQLCEHPNKSLADGLTCSLTNKKPDFNKTCPTIKISHSTKRHYLRLKNQIETHGSKMPSTYSFAFVNLGIGLFIILGSYYLFEETFKLDLGFTALNYFELSLFVFLIGTLFVSLGFGILMRYYHKLRKLKSKKSKIDAVLRNYNKEFYI